MRVSSFRGNWFQLLCVFPQVFLCILIAGCGGGPSISGNASKTVTGIAVSPKTPSIAAGTTQQFSATATYADGTTSDVSAVASWSVSSSSVATVNTTGMATGVAAGSTTVTASLNSVSGNAILTVTAAPKTITSIAVTPGMPSIQVGATLQLTATATYSDGSTANVTSTVTWSSSSAAIATVNASGLATGVAAGSATITATQSGVNGTSALAVTALPPPVKTLTSIAVTPAAPSITAGATQQFTATGTYSDNSTANITSSVTWTSGTTSVATINAAGLATAVSAGSSTITATLSGISSNAATLTVTKTVTAIAITPSPASLAVGATQQFRVTATYSDGTTGPVTTGVTWSVGNTSFATISATGLATGVATGSTTVTATLGSLTKTVNLVVNAKAAKSIAITPDPGSFAMGATQQFTAVATYTDNTTGNVTSTATWSIANQAVATITNAGLATGVASGSSTVMATYDSVNATAPITVTVPANATTDVLMWHYDQSRTGNNPKETSLAPANVSAQTFGKLFSYQVDGYMYAEPVLKSGVTINGAVHNVVYVATENDSVYAFDADNYGTGAPLWQKTLLQNDETPLTNGPIKPVEGVTSTPVIDPSTNTIYVVSSQTSPTTGSSFRLHAMDITTGAEKFGGPVKLNVSVPATNSDSVNGVQTLTTSCIQRAALLLANGNIYMGFASCHSGWLVAYSASTLQKVGVFNSSVTLNGEGPYASAGGIWMGAGGPVADSAGNVYVTTGNGPWNGTDAWGDSFLKFGPTPVAGANGTMQPTDWFTPGVYQYMDCNDADLAAGGLLLMPNANQLLGGGKTGTMFVVNSANLGKESATDAGVTQEQVWGAGLTNGGTYQNSCLDVNGTTYYANITSYEIFGTAAYFNNSVYLGVTPTSSTAPGGVRQFTVSQTGTLTPSAISQPTINQGTRGTSPFISSSGTSNGIVWMIDQGYPIQNTDTEPGTGSKVPPTNATLYAYKADQFPAELYDSTQNAGDTPGYGIKFSSPVVANGKVYISTGHDLTAATGELDVYGLK
jgi:uncharacterized protein YjdB